MAVKVQGYDGNPFDQRSIMSFMRFLTTIHRLILSGNYATGGDTLDWTNAGINSAVPPDAPSLIGPDRCDVNDNAFSGATVLGAGGNYILIPGTNLTNWKLKIFKTAGAEYGAGAYVADALTEVLLIKSDWFRS